MEIINDIMEKAKADVKKLIEKVQVRSSASGDKTRVGSCADGSAGCAHGAGPSWVVSSTLPRLQTNDLEQQPGRTIMESFENQASGSVWQRRAALGFCARRPCCSGQQCR